MNFWLLLNAKYKIFAALACETLNFCPFENVKHVIFGSFRILIYRITFTMSRAQNF